MLHSFYFVFYKQVSYEFFDREKRYLILFIIEEIRFWFFNTKEIIYSCLFSAFNFTDGEDIKSGRRYVRGVSFLQRCQCCKDI